MRLQDVSTLIQEHTALDLRFQKEISDKIELLMTNHLPHLQIQMEALQTKIKLMLWLLAAITVPVIAAIIAAIFRLILK